MKEDKKVRDLLTKKPFRRVIPNRMAAMPIIFADGTTPPNKEDGNEYIMMSQADFLREYYPGGHIINDPNHYPDVYREVEEEANETDENGAPVVVTKVYCERVPRYSFAYQQIIALNHIIHATGNDVQHELSITNPSEAQKMLFDDMTATWQEWGSEEAWYEAFKAREIVADTAAVGSIDENGREFHWNVFSYQKGDKIYPHFDEYGRLSIFARKTSQYDDEGNALVDTVEVWDSKNYSVYRRDMTTEQTVIGKLKGFLGLSGYSLVMTKPHGFPFIPVSYMRDDDGPGWTPSQDAIDCYELSFSQMAHNNQAFGEAILTVQVGDDSSQPNIIHGLNGTIKEIDYGKDDKVGFLEGQSAAESYMKQLEITDEMIYRGSNTVKTPKELKAGDTPASAIKLLFAPSLNQAIADGNECKPFLKDMWRIMAYAYGRIKGNLVDAQALPVLSWVKPYVHLSESAIATDLVSLVKAKIISRQTASERASFYSKPGEMERISAEDKASRDADLLFEVEQLKANSKFDNSGTTASAQQTEE